MTKILHPNGFSLELARKLGGLSKVVYYDEPRFTFEDVLVQDVQLDIRAVIYDFKDHTSIAFRGTVDLENWLLNFKVFKRALACGVMVHDGFLQAADALLPRIIHALLPAGADKSKLKPIHITGHSLGGALASLVALFLQREGWPVASVYTFASPRVGNAAWRKTYMEALGEKSYRVIAEGDLVPLLPGVLDSYRHVGQEIMLLRDGSVYACPPHWWELLRDTFTVTRALWKGDTQAITRLHSINADYLRLINLAFQRQA